MPWVRRPLGSSSGLMSKMSSSLQHDRSDVMDHSDAEGGKFMFMMTIPTKPDWCPSCLRLFFSKTEVMWWTNLMPLEGCSRWGVQPRQADVSTQTPARLLDVKVDVAELFITTGNQHASYQSYAFLILTECFWLRLKCFNASVVSHSRLIQMKK